MKDLEAALASDDAEERRQATAALVERNPEGRTRLLVRALGDVDWRVRKEGVRVAAEVGEAWGLLPELVDALCQGENVGLRNAALEVLERLGPRSANALLVALPRVPSAARKFLVQALGFAGGAGVDSLAQLSADPDPNTAQAALEALARIGGARAEEALRAHLSGGEPIQRLAALEGLERLEANVSVEALRPLLGDRLMRRMALGLLGFSSDPDAGPVLLAAMQDTSTATSAEAVRSVGRLLARGGPAAAEVGEAAAGLGADGRRALRVLAAGGASDDLRVGAVWILMLARDPEAAGEAAALVSDDRLPPPALEAIRAWGADGVEAFLHAQEELPPSARGAALEIAVDLASESEQEARYADGLRAALRGALASQEPRLIVAAARGLERWAEAPDAPRLVEVALHVERARGAAGRTLEALARRHPAAVAEALEGVALDGPGGAALLPAVAAVGGEAAFDRLAQALNAHDPGARRAALIALPSLGGERAAELAGFALADEDIDVQAAAVRVLAQLGEDGLGGPQLRLAVRASAEPVAAAAARALGRLADRGAIPALRELVSEGRRGVAVAALEALRAMGDDAVDELLVEALGSADSELVKEALRAIAQSDTPRRGARIALALEHSAWDVRQLAASLLGRLGGPEDRRALEERAEREVDAGVQAAIERALQGPVEAD